MEAFRIYKCKENTVLETPDIDCKHMAKSLLLIPEILLIHIFNQANRFRYSIYIIKPRNNYFKKINYKEMHFSNNNSNKSLIV